MSIYLTTPTIDLLLSSTDGTISSIKHLGTELLLPGSVAQWQKIVEGVSTLQEDTLSDTSLSGTTVARDGSLDVRLTPAPLGLQNVFEYRTKTAITVPTSGSNPSLSGVTQGYNLTGRLSKIVPHFATVPIFAQMDIPFQDTRYSLDMFGETTLTTSLTNTPREFSGGPVSTSADGMLGMGIYSFGPRLDPNPKTTRWAQAGEIAPMQEWQDGIPAPVSIQHHKMFLVTGNAQEIFDAFTDLHNYQLAAYEIRRKNAVRLDAPIS